MKKHCDQVVSGACCLERPLTVETFDYDVARVLALTEPELAALSEFNLLLVVTWVCGMWEISRVPHTQEWRERYGLADERLKRVMNATRNSRDGTGRCSPMLDACRLSPLGRSRCSRRRRGRRSGRGVIPDPRSCAP